MLVFSGLMRDGGILKVQTTTISTGMRPISRINNAPIMVPGSQLHAWNYYCNLQDLVRFRVI